MSLHRRLSRSTNRQLPTLSTSSFPQQYPLKHTADENGTKDDNLQNTKNACISSGMDDLFQTMTPLESFSAKPKTSNITFQPAMRLWCICAVFAANIFGYNLRLNDVGSFTTINNKESSESADDFGTRGDSADEPEQSTEGLSAPPPPKHIPFPEVPQSSELINELLMFGYTVLATSLQFLHLYRTVWWLPESHTRYAMNFYLIDPYLSSFIYVLLSRRLMYLLISKVVHLFCPRYAIGFVLTVIRFAIFFAIILLMTVCCLMFYDHHQYEVYYLCYPVPIYFLLFGLRLEPFLRTTFESRETTYLNASPLHCCSSNPHSIRYEVNSLKCDYNNRFKQVVFTTLANAYYAGFIPCCFAQNFLYYDIYWATQHMAFLIFGGFTMCAMICFPANYCDVLHRAALHLGQWHRVDPLKCTDLAMCYSADLIWPSGAVVRHKRIKYKSLGLATTAEPGNAVHQRFYIFFQNPSYLYCMLTVVQVSVVILQLIVMYFVIEWHNTLSLSFLILANYHTLFKTVRDLFVTQKIYAAESTIYDKLCAGTTIT